jgi:lysozyme family protein
MSDFETAIKRTLVHEGGFQKNPQDHANWSSGKIGEGQLIGTKYGITALDMPGVDIENITVNQAIAYYAEHYWKTLYSQIDSQAVADKLFDLGVLFGVETAVAMMQTTLETAGFNTVDVDGIFGKETLSAINQSDSDSLLKAYEANMVTHTFNIATHKPAERQFLAGWGRRINCADEAPCEKCS